MSKLESAMEKVLDAFKAAAAESHSKSDPESDSDDETRTITKKKMREYLDKELNKWRRVITVVVHPPLLSLQTQI